MVEENLKNRDIEKLLDFNTQKVSDLKTSSQSITPEIALELEDNFGLNPCWLIFGRGNMMITKEDNNLVEVFQKKDSANEITIKIKIN